MDLHFKILRAHEDIDRLNIKIRRLVTFIRDEQPFLQRKVAEFQTLDSVLAHHIRQSAVGLLLNISHVCKDLRIACVFRFLGSWITADIRIGPSLIWSQEPSRTRGHPSQTLRYSWFLGTRSPADI
jgi:hypothetical protein